MHKAAIRFAESAITDLQAIRSWYTAKGCLMSEIDLSSRSSPASKGCRTTQRWAGSCPSLIGRSSESRSILHFALSTASNQGASGSYASGVVNGYCRAWETKTSEAVTFVPGCSGPRDRLARWLCAPSPSAVAYLEACLAGLPSAHGNAKSRANSGPNCLGTPHYPWQS